MPKNKAMLINYKLQEVRNKILNEKIALIVPECYAAIALALHRECGWEYEDINAVFVESQSIWQECVDNRADMIQMCYDETGIEVAGKQTE